MGGATIPGRRKAEHLDNPFAALKTAVRNDRPPPIPGHRVYEPSGSPGGRASSLERFHNGNVIGNEKLSGETGTVDAPFIAGPSTLRHLSRPRLRYLYLNRGSWQLLLKAIEEREILRSDE